MEFGLNEILTIIDKVKSTELSLFEYQDKDTRIRIKGTGQIAEVAAPGNANAISGTAASAATDSGTTSDAGKIISSPMVGTFYTASAEG